MSKEQFFKKLQPLDRVQALKDNAVECYQKNVIRNFSEEELVEMKSDLSEVDISFNDLEMEKKEMVAEINDKIKVYKDKRSLLLKHLKDKYYESNEDVFDIDNQEDGVMETYDKQGNLLTTRRLTPKERQTTIKNLKQAE